MNILENIRQSTIVNAAKLIKISDQLEAIMNVNKMKQDFGNCQGNDSCPHRSSINIIRSPRTTTEDPDNQKSPLIAISRSKNIKTLRLESRVNSKKLSINDLFSKEARRYVEPNPKLSRISSCRISASNQKVRIKTFPITKLPVLARARTTSNSAANLSGRGKAPGLGGLCKTEKNNVSVVSGSLRVEQHIGRQELPVQQMKDPLFIINSLAAPLSGKSRVSPFDRIRSERIEDQENTLLNCYEGAMWSSDYDSDD